MTYRDETTALAEQNNALEREISEKNREIVALRDAAVRGETVPSASVAITARHSRDLRFALFSAIAALGLFATALFASQTSVARPPWDVLLALAGAGTVMLLLVGFGALLRGSYVIVPPGIALIFSTGRGHQVTMPGHARMVFPFALTTWVDVSPHTVRTVIEVQLRDDRRCAIELVARTQPRSTTESILRFFERFHSATGPDRDELVRARLDSAARSVLSHASTQELDRDRIEFEDRVRSELQSPLDDVGLDLVEVSFTVRSIAVPSAPL